MNFTFKKRVYLDYASATPICREVLRDVSKVYKHFANPGSLYLDGRNTKRKIDEQRLKVSKILNCKQDEIIFTSGGTESNNLAIFGAVESFLNSHPDEVPHIITTSIEHSSVLEVFSKLKTKKVEVSVIDAEENGIINPKKIRESLKENTILVSVMYANNEIGTIQPIKEISKVIHRYKTDKINLYSSNYPLLHTDAAQAANYLSLDTILLGVDLMSIDGGKIYGFKGTGCLYKSRKVLLAPQIIGGGQESGLRSGTESLANIVSFATALEVAQKIKDKENSRLKKIQDYFFRRLDEISGATINGDLNNRLTNNISVCISGIDSEFAVFCLDEGGVCSSSASTCMNNKEDSYSYVIKSINKDGNCEKSSLRFTLGRFSKKSHVDKCIKLLKKSLKLQIYK